MNAKEVDSLIKLAERQQKEIEVLEGKIESAYKEAHISGQILGGKVTVGAANEGWLEYQELEAIRSD